MRTEGRRGRRGRTSLTERARRCVAVLVLAMGGCATLSGPGASSATPFVTLGSSGSFSTGRSRRPLRATLGRDQAASHSPAQRPPVALEAVAARGTRPTRTASRRGAGGKGEGAQCYRALRRKAVRFSRVAKAKTRGVAYPIRLTGPVGGIEIRGTGKSGAPTNYLDCRLAQSLLAWAPTLRRAGVVAIDHYSAYRKNAIVAGSKKVSAHASAMAIDAARFHLKDGRTADVLKDWRLKARGADPCKVRPRESPKAKLMRRVVCKAAEQNIFHVVITPHYNRAHRNHVHLEIADHARATWIR